MARATSDKREKRKQRYQEISDWLTAQCATLPPGSAVPSEAQLAEQFKVSRMTARHALETVRAAGRIERRKGVGSFVAQAALHRTESVLRSFSDEIRRRDGEPSSIIIEQGLVVLPSQALLMGLDPHDPMVRIDRVRIATPLRPARLPTDQAT